MTDYSGEKIGESLCKGYFEVVSHIMSQRSYTLQVVLLSDSDVKLIHRILI